MNLAEAFRIALRALRANGLRSALTTLGIIIGVGAVIILVGLGNGIQTGFNERFASLATQITVTKTQGSVPGGGAAQDLTDSDVEALRDRTDAPDIATVTPVIAGTALLQEGTGQFRTSITGSTAGYLGVVDRELIVGSFFTEVQERSNARVVVLGPDPVANLFGGDAAAALGKDIRVGRTTFEVIGVVEGDGRQDDVAIMPLGAVRAYLLGGSESVNSIIVQAVGTTRVNAALDQVTQILSDRHKIRDPAERDFDAQALQQTLEDVNQTLGYLNLFTVAVAAISLVVGGIGVANIMLVSVTERTREIGIRKAIGAPRSAIVKQFLIESTMLAAIGGVVGIVVGVGVTVAAAQILPQAVPDFPAPEVSLSAIALAFGVSLAIGLVAGGYPANRAARMRPIEALRYQ